MKFNIAAKLGFMAAFVSLLATAVVGYWAMEQGRDILTTHELVDLTDETELRVYELMNDFRYLRRDARDIASPQSQNGEPAKLKTQDLLQDITQYPDGDKGKNAKKTLEKAIDDILKKPENYYYLEMICVPVRDGSPAVLEKPVLARGRPAAGAPVGDVSEIHGLRQEESIKKLLASKQSAREFRNYLFPIRAFTRSDKANDPRNITPLLLTVASPVGRNQEIMPPAMVFLTVDFEEFIRARTRGLPRHLVYLTDDDGSLLIHPWAHRQQEIREASASSATYEKLPKLMDEGPLELFAADFAKKTSEQQQHFRNQRGNQVPDGRLKDVEFYHTVQTLTWPDSENRTEELAKGLRGFLREKAVEYPSLRFHAPGYRTPALELSVPDKADLDSVRKAIEEWQKEHDWKPGPWRSPVHCKSFAIRLMFLNPDLDSRNAPDAAVQEDKSGVRPRFFGFAMAASLEEIQHDVTAKTAWMWWWVLGLGLGAAGVAWIFSGYLTRPLKSIIKATEAVSKGSIELEFPAPLPVESRDEIGVLARSFSHMLEQLKLRRAALNETLARMKAVLDTAAEGIVVFDDHGKIESFNQAAEQIFGWRAGEMHDKKIDLLMEFHRTNNGVPEAEAGGTSDSVRMVHQVVRTRGETTGKRKDGSSFPMEVAFSELPLQGRRIITGIFRDITERKKAEEAIKRANEELDARVRLRTFELEDAMGKLEAALQGAIDATKAKDSFLASMSHELRTPLNAIIGYTELLMDGAGDDGYESIVPDLNKIHTAGKHLLELINDILDLSKVAAGQMKLNLTDFDLKPLVEAIKGMGNPLAKQFGNELAFELGPNLGRMHADEKRVRQVLLNLLSNACKFTDKGKITVRVFRESNANDDEIVLQVHDTGIGMTPDQLRRLGEVFYQVDASNTRKKGGTGLGMAISKTFVNLMSGTFEVKSELGKGSTFTVRLPAVVELRAETPTPRQAEPALQPLTGPRNLVLVVDDDPQARELIERFLEKEGMRVKVVENGKDVMHLARELRPVAITLDVNMPGLDGWTLLAALKTDPMTADIPVIMLTIEDNPKRGFALGASDYLTKPIDWDRLVVVLHRYCRAVDSAPILIVEDDPVSREMVLRMLQREGRTAIGAENGRVALERLLSGLRPALILLDLMMPEMDGFQFLEELRKHPALNGTPIVVVTAKELSNEERELLNGSVAQVLRKGEFSTEQLLQQLKGRVQQHLHHPASPEPAPATAG